MVILDDGSILDVILSYSVLFIVSVFATSVCWMGIAASLPAMKIVGVGLDQHRKAHVEQMCN